jgi:hypothetical protein
LSAKRAKTGWSGHIVRLLQRPILHHNLVILRLCLCVWCWLAALLSPNLTAQAQHACWSCGWSCSSINVVLCRLRLCLVWLQVCPCICFCAYVEQQLQEMHDNAEVMMARIVQEQQQQEQESQQEAPALQQQQQQLSNGHTQHWPEDQQQQQQQLHPSASANGGAHPGAAGGNISRDGAHAQRQQQQPRASDADALAAVAAAASTKLRVLGRPISEFSSCRREWVLKLGKAVAMGFMQKAAGEECNES